MSTIRVLGNDQCPFCVKVKNYLNKNNIKYQWIDTESENGKAQRTKLSAQEKYYTIPMVYIDNKFIGGCNEFFNDLSKNKFKL